MRAAVRAALIEHAAPIAFHGMPTHLS